MLFSSRLSYLRFGLILAIVLPLMAGGFFVANAFSPDEPQAILCHGPETVVFAPTSPTFNEMDDDQEIFKVVDQMPVYPGAACGDIKKYEERKRCGEKAMLGYIYSNVKYPQNAREDGVEGLAVVRFVVEKHGVMSNIEVVRDPGAGLGEEAARVVRRMKADNIRWEPGLLKGKTVRVQYNLPVRFKLE